MEKFLVLILLVISSISQAQNVKYFQTFGWENSELSLYYSNDTTHYWEKKIKLQWIYTI